MFPKKGLVITISPHKSKLNSSVEILMHIEIHKVKKFIVTFLLAYSFEIAIVNPITSYLATLSLPCPIL